MLFIGRGWLGDGVLLFARYSPRARAGSQFQKRDCIHFACVSKLYAYNIYIYIVYNVCVIYYAVVGGDEEDNEVSSSRHIYIVLYNIIVTINSLAARRLVISNRFGLCSAAITGPLLLVSFRHLAEILHMY